MAAVISNIYFDRSRRQFQLKSRIGSGGEGDVFEIDGELSATHVVKIYKGIITKEKEEKLFVMVNSFNQELEKIAAWPKDVLLDRTGKVCGFLMPKISGYKPIHELYNPGARKKYFPDADWAFIINATKNLIAAINTIHFFGVIIGDVNEGNILVSDKSLIKLIDCDSFQVEKNGRRYPCDVGIPMYTPPELQGIKSYRDYLRTANHDLFGLAVISFQLLFMGRHPYVGIYNGPDVPLEKSIEKYLFAYGRHGSKNDVKPPGGALSYDAIPRNLQAVFEQSFTQVGAVGRPTTDIWFEQIEYLKTHLKVCNKDSKHKYYEGVGECPWCVFENSQGIYYFISSRIGSFNLGGFNLEEVWKKLEGITLPKDEIKNPSDFKVAGGYPPVKFYLLRLFQFGQKISSVIIPLILLFNISSINGFVVLASFFLGFWFYHSKIFETQIESFYSERKIRFDATKEKWEHIRDKYYNSTQGNFNRIWDELKISKTKYQNLGTDYNRERMLLQSNLKDYQLQKFLGRFFIDSNSISGIGEYRKLTLASFGIETAADIIKFKKINVPGFGPVLRTSLMEWQNRLTRQFVFDPSKGVDIEDMNKLNRKYENLKSELQKKLSGGIEKLTSIRYATLTTREAFKNDIEDAAKKFQLAKLDLERMSFL